jgi:hypothetical protein
MIQIPATLLRRPAGFDPTVISCELIITEAAAPLSIVTALG